MVIRGEVDLDLNEQIGDPDGDTLFVFSPQIVGDEAATHRLHVLSLSVRGDWKPAVSYRRVGGRIVTYLRLRFMGIDTPEIHYGPVGRPDRRDPNVQPPFRQNCGYVAKQALETLANQGVGRAVEVRRTLDNGDLRRLFDSYGRTLGYLYADGINVNLQMLNSGMAFPFLFDDMPADELAQFAQAAESAYEQSPTRSTIGQSTHRLITDLERTADEVFFDLGPVNIPRFFRRFVEWRVLHTQDDPDFVAWLRQSDHNSRWRVNGQGTDFYFLADALDTAGNLRPELDPWEIVYHQDAHDVPGDEMFSESADALNDRQRTLREEAGVLQP